MCLFNLGFLFGKTGNLTFCNLCSINQPLLAEYKLRDFKSVRWRAKAIAYPKLYKSVFVVFKTDRVDATNDS